MFPADLTSVLSGASIHQLARWRRTNLLVPEVAKRPLALYSFRDVVALRTVVFLRSKVSLQKVRKAFNNLPILDFTEHPAAYRFATDGKSVGVLDENEHIVDLTVNLGQARFFSLADVFAPFHAQSGHEVVDFRKPREHLSIRARRLGGWPTIEDTRVGYDSVAKLVVGGVAPDDVQRFYPSVSADAAVDAVDLYEEVDSVRRRRAS
jgi:uncharacterized protein (DUF433 family)